MRLALAAVAAVVMLTLLAGCDTPEAHLNAHDAIHQTFGEISPGVEQQALNVSWCESRWDPHAVSPGGGNLGLFQINVVHRASFEAVTGEPWSEVFDPYVNSVFALWLWKQQSWGPWSCKGAA